MHGVQVMRRDGVCRSCGVTGSAVLTLTLTNLGWHCGQTDYAWWQPLSSCFLLQRLMGNYAVGRGSESVPQVHWSMVKESQGSVLLEYRMMLGICPLLFQVYEQLEPCHTAPLPSSTSLRYFIMGSLTVPLIWLISENNWLYLLWLGCCPGWSN